MVLSSQISVDSVVYIDADADDVVATAHPFFMLTPASKQFQPIRESHPHAVDQCHNFIELFLHSNIRPDYI